MAKLDDHILTIDLKEATLLSVMLLGMETSNEDELEAMANQIGFEGAKELHDVIDSLGNKFCENWKELKEAANCPATA